MCFLMICMFNEKKKKNSILFNAPKDVQKDLTVPLSRCWHCLRENMLYQMQGISGEPRAAVA